MLRTYVLCEAQAALSQAFLIRFGTDFEFMKRSQSPVLDASDRAQKMRRTGLVRVHCKKIGFMPDNRGGVGILPWHIHEVAFDIKTNTTKRGATRVRT